MLGEINCICCQTPSSDLSLLGLYFQIPHTLLAQQHMRTGTGAAVGSSHLVSATPSPSAGGLLTLFPSSRMGSLPWETAFYKLLQHESLPQAAILHKLLQHGLLLRVQLFKNRLLQCGSPMGSQVLPGTCCSVSSSLHWSVDFARSL